MTTSTATSGQSGATWTTGPLVDHHCHGLFTQDLDRVGFEAAMNEASGSSRLGTTVFDSMLGLAMRRWCPPVLDLPELCDPDTYLARRRELGVEEVNRRLVRAAGIDTFLVDTGLAPEGSTSPGELAGLCAGTGHEVLRLEVLAERLLRDGVHGEDFAAGVEAELRATSAVAAKSIAAYRVGLRLPASRPRAGELFRALDAVPRSGPLRLADPVVSGWLAWTALEAGLPLQLHVGYGDRDVDLAECDPLLLTAFLRATSDRGVPVLLLHNYPFHRHAAYLAQVFEHVFVDVGLATHNTGALSPALLRETLELAPFGKVLFSSDAFGLAEHYLLGSVLFRRALDSVLDALVASGDAGADDVPHVVRLVCRENALRAYRLPR